MWSDSDEEEGGSPGESLYLRHRMAAPSILGTRFLYKISSSSRGSLSSVLIRHDPKCYHLFHEK